MNITSPLFATGVGLVLKGFEQYDREKAKSVQKQNDKVQGSILQKRKAGFL